MVNMALEKIVLILNMSKNINNIKNYFARSVIIESSTKSMFKNSQWGYNYNFIM